MKIAAVAPWFGSNRVSAEAVGRELGQLAWCGVPFAGGCPELPWIRCRAGVANDRHRHVINLCRVIANDQMLQDMLILLDQLLFHPDVLKSAQLRCIEREYETADTMFASARPLRNAPDLDWAVDYFVAAWMGRGGHSGKQYEFTQGLSVRRTSSGGDSAVRFRSAQDSLRAWNRALRRWNFTTDDGIEFVQAVRDQEGHGIYVDAPWPDLGEEYRVQFPMAHHARLRDALERFSKVRIVVRYGDHPLVEELYSGPRWRRKRKRKLPTVRPSSG